MDLSFLEDYGISKDTFNYIVLPLLIFLARIGDVSFATLRIIFLMGGKRTLAPILGFFEAFIWLLAIGQIIQNIDNFVSYIAYAAGFATGTYVGMVIEEKLALGHVVVRVITRTPAVNLIEFLKKKKFKYSNIDAEGNDGPVNVLFSVIKREQLPSLINSIKSFNPKAFYTVEGVKKASDDDIAESKSRVMFSRLLNLKRR